MPLHLPPLSRRKFLAGSAAAGLGALVYPARLSATETAHADQWVLISDTHINSDPATIHRGVNMTTNLQQVIREILELAERPAGVILSGDCAHRNGQLGDYTQLAHLLTPLTEDKLPIHLLMGNHDQRANFRQALAQQFPQQSLVEGKFVSVVETPRANWFLLDSLVVNQSSGRIGQDQLKWLAAALDARTNKPALVVGHHNPRFDTPVTVNDGLLDTHELFDVLTPRRQVKAFFFGHSHTWGLSKHEGIHLVNLPPTAYLFLPGWPIGWVDLRLAGDGASLELHAIDKKHRAQVQRVELAWRT